MSNALRAVNTKATPQVYSARADQVANSAGGFVFTVSAKDRLERFLILGTDKGTYYASEQKHTNDNVDFLRKLIAKDEDLVRRTILDVSKNNRAYKNSPAIFALALLLSEGQDKSATRAIVNDVCRTSTHLFEFGEYLDNLGGWGRSKRNAVANWYANKDDDALAYQMVKYRQRNGWTHRDMLRLSHADSLSSNLANFALGKPLEGDVPMTIQGFLAAQQATTAAEAIEVLNQYKNLPWETLPTQVLTDKDVWRTLFYNGQLKGQALLRNITRLAKNGAFNDREFAKNVAKVLSDPEAIKAGRLHPVNYVNALFAYTKGVSPRRDAGYGWGYLQREKDWDVKSPIKDALEDGFYASFGAIEPANKATLLALDISDSMGQAALGLQLSCAEVSAVMAMTIARTEPDYEIRGFSTQFKDLGISAKTDLTAAINKVSNQNFGGTDCSLPMEWAIKNDLGIETFAVFTDNETYAGARHPFQALKDYRAKSGKDARLAVFGVAATNFTIADPKDKGMLDFVGFDAAAPRVFADFSAGRL